MAAGVAVALAVAVVRLGVLDAELPHPPEPREWVLAAVGGLLGLRVVAYVPSNPVGWLLIALGGTAAVTVLAATWDEPVWVVWLRIVTWWPVYALVVLLALLFPEGRPGSRPWALLLTATVVAAAVATVGFAIAAWDDPAGFLDRPPGAPDLRLVAASAAAALAVVVGGIGAAAGFVARARRATGRARRLAGWVAGAVLLLVVADVLEVIGLPVVWVAGALAFPAAAVLAVVRFGLYDIDLLVHRTLLYSGVTVALLAVYAGVVTLLAGLVPAGAAPVAAAAVVVAVAPVSRFAHLRLDRLVYGDRRRPYEVMTQLAARLEDVPGPVHVLHTIIDTVVLAMRVPHVALVLAGGARPAAEAGRTRSRPVVVVPVTYQGAEVGRMLVEQRSPDERFTGPERELLTNLARQVGAVVHAVALAGELQRSRERIVIAREEERKRLRRDLHDGLGPSLAGMRMQLRTVVARLPAGAPAAALVERLSADLAGAVEELRTAVDDLRPPGLDEGLPAAVRAELARFASAEGAPAMSLEAGAGLGALPAAVEVAAFRIVAEALTNVVRHAGARTCTVRLDRDEVGGMPALHVEVVDDGVGITTPRPGGVGIGSMQERARELGGDCTVAGNAAGGCRVRARLPMPAAPPSDTHGSASTT